MKKYREEFRLIENLVYALLLTNVEASRTTIVGNADRNRGPVRTEYLCVLIMCKPCKPCLPRQYTRPTFLRTSEFRVCIAGLNPANKLVCMLCHVHYLSQDSSRCILVQPIAQLGNPPLSNNHTVNWNDL